LSKSFYLPFRLRTSFKKKKIIFIFCIAAVILINKSFALEDRDFSIANTYYNNGEYLKAIRFYKKLLDANELQGYLNLAVIFKDLGNYPQAIKVLNRAIKNGFQENTQILSLLGRLYYLNYQLDEAINVLKEVLAIEPNNLEANINLGLCFQEKGEYLQAQYYFQKAISLNPNNILSHISLADLYSSQGNIQQAVEEYQKVNFLDASILSIQKIIAEFLLKLGNLQESLKIYQRIILREPKNKLIQAKIAELKDKLGKDYFEKEKKRLALVRENKSILVHAFPFNKKIPYVRVGLMEQERYVEFKCSTDFEIKTKSAVQVLADGRGNEIYRISKGEDGKIMVTDSKGNNFIVNETILIKPKQPEGTITMFNVLQGKENFWMRKADRTYRGVMEVAFDKTGLRIINIVNLEEYLYSVVPSEMFPEWPKEALKAQAVASRTQALKKLGRHREEGFDFCSQVHCQVYAGVESETEKTRQAVDETRGIILVYDDKPIDAIYSSNCGGYTQDNIFGDKKDIPYLKGKPDILEGKVSIPFSPIDLEYWIKNPPQDLLCNVNNSNFRWVRIYSYEEMKELLSRFKDAGEIKKIIITKRNKSGHIIQIKIIGADNTYLLEKELEIRNTLGGLRSSMFKIEIKKDLGGKPQKFIFYGGGFGHGVGMCQQGAYGLAIRGKDYKDILRHYFEKIEFKKIY